MSIDRNSNSERKWGVERTSEISLHSTKLTQRATAAMNISPLRGGSAIRPLVSSFAQPDHDAGVFTLLLMILFFGTAVTAQTRTYPKEIRGYKVERTVVELKKRDAKDNQSKTDGASNEDSGVDQLITFGQPQLERITPLGITFKVPIVVAPVRQNGHVDFLVFEDMLINGRSVEINEYQRAFDLPNKHTLTLRDPLNIYIYLPGAVLAALGEWTDSKETWPVTGRVYVFGKFKKSLFSFKRCVPVELNLTMRNPLKEQ